MTQTKISEFCVKDEKIKRAWIWDRIQSQEVSTLKKVDINDNCLQGLNTETYQCKYSSTKPFSDLNEAQITSKLRQQSSDIKSLKATLLQKKKASQHNVEHLSDRWLRRLEDKKKEHEQKLNKQTAFISQLKRDCKEILDKKQFLIKEIEEIFLTQQGKFDRVAINGDCSIENAKEFWEDDEQTSLQTFINAISNDLKKDVAKSLEPEILELIAKQKSDSETLRLNMTSEVENFKLKIEQQCRDSINMDIKDTKRQKQMEEDEFRKKRSIFVSQLVNRHMDELKGVRSTWRANMSRDDAKFQLEKEKRTNECAEEIGHLCIDKDLVYNQLLKAHRGEIQTLEQKQTSWLNTRKDEYTKVTNEWKESYACEVQNKFNLKEEESENRIQKYLLCEFDNIAIKIHSEVNEKKNSGKDIVENRLKETQDSHDRDTALLMDEWKALKNKWSNILEKHSTSKTEILKMKSHVTKLEDEQHLYGNNLVEIKNKKESFMREQPKTINQIYSELEKKIAGEESKRDSVDKDIQQIMRNYDCILSSNENKIMKLKVELEKDASIVDERVKNLLAQKQNVLDQNYEKLRKMMEEEHDLQLRMDSKRAESMLR